MTFMNTGIHSTYQRGLENVINKDYNSGQNLSEELRLKTLRIFAKPLPHSSFFEYVSPKRISAYFTCLKNEFKHFISKYRN